MSLFYQILISPFTSPDTHAAATVAETSLAGAAPAKTTPARKSAKATEYEDEPLFI